MKVQVLFKVFYADDEGLHSILESVRRTRYGLDYGLWQWTEGVDGFGVFCFTDIRSALGLAARSFIVSENCEISVGIGIDELPVNSILIVTTFDEHLANYFWRQGLFKRSVSIYEKALHVSFSTGVEMYLGAPLINSVVVRKFMPVVSVRYADFNNVNAGLTGQQYLNRFVVALEQVLPDEVDSALELALMVPELKQLVNSLHV